MDKVQNYARFATNSLSCYCEPDARLTFPLYIVFRSLYINVPSDNLSEVPLRVFLRFLTILVRLCPCGMSLFAIVTRWSFSLVSKM